MAFAPFAPLGGGILRRPQAIPYTPEEEESLLGTVGSAGLSGLSAAGNVLDTFGGAVRGLLAGDPLSGLSSLGNPISGRGRLSGRDMLERWGMLRRNRPGFHPIDHPGDAFGDVLGFGAEILTDPLTYFTGGLSALGKAGKVAKNSGLLGGAMRVAKTAKGGKYVGPRVARTTTTLDDLLKSAPNPADATRKATDAATGLGFKLGDVSGDVLSRGAGFDFGRLGFIPVPGTPRIAAGMDRLGELARFSGPGRLVHKMLDASNLGRSTRAGQESAQELFQKQREIHGTNDAWQAELARRMEKNAASLPPSPLLRSMIEGVQGMSPAMDPTGIASELAAVSPRTLAEGQRLGVGAINPLADPFIQHSPRYGDFPEEMAGGRPGPLGGPFSATGREVKSRKEWWKGFAGGTAGPLGVNELVTDSGIQQLIANMRARGLSHRKIVTKVREEIELKYGPFVRPEYPVLTKSGKPKLDPTGAPVVRDQYRKLADVLVKGLGDDVAARGLFPNNPLIDTGMHKRSAELRQAAAESAYDLLAQHAKPKGSFAAGAKTVSLGKAFKAMGLKTALKGGVTEGAAAEFARRAGLAAPTKKSQVIALMRQQIPADIAKDLVGARESIRGTSGMMTVGGALDSYSNLFKAGVLAAPARIVRDFTSGQLKNAEQGVSSLGSIFGTSKVLRGGPIADAVQAPAVQDWLATRGLPPTPENATEALRMLYIQHVGAGANHWTDVAGAGKHSDQKIDDILNDIPGRTPKTVGQSVKDVFSTAINRTPGTSWNPLKTRGVGGREETAFGPFLAAEKAGAWTDQMNRMVPFMEMLKKGVDPAEAGRRIDDMQVAYHPRNFTAEEKLLKRVFPFYSFTSGMGKHVAKELYQRPGGPLAMQVKATNRAKGDDDQPLPEHVSNTAAIPLGDLPDGTKRYLAGLGLMHEGPLSFLGIGPAGLKGLPADVGLEMLSQSNPLIKWPLEAATGQSFFQKGPEGGRPLEDLDPTVGRIVANVTGAEKPMEFPGSDQIEHALGNSPLSRLLSSARTATDKRKGPAAKAANLLTGLRVTDVSPASQDALIRESTNALMREEGAKEFLRVYFSEEDRAKMPPEQRAKAERLMALQKLLADRAKRRKKEREKAGK